MTVKPDFLSPAFPGCETKLNTDALIFQSNH